MKKIIFFLLTALPALAFAQFNKGNIFLGGAFSSTLSNSDSRTNPANPYSSTNNGVAIYPTFGFFLNEKLAIGTSLTYSTSLQKNESPGYFYKYENNSIGISPYMRYYFPISSSVYFGLQGGLNFSRGNSKTTQTSGPFQSVTETPTYGLGLNFKPVFVFFPSPKWGIEASFASLGYNYYRNLPDVSSASSFGLSAGSFSFGVAYYFIK